MWTITIRIGTLRDYRDETIKDILANSSPVFVAEAFNYHAKKEYIAERRPSEFSDKEIRKCEAIKKICIEELDRRSHDYSLDITYYYDQVSLVENPSLFSFKKPVEARRLWL